MAKVAKTLIAFRLSAEAVQVVRFWSEQDRSSQAEVAEKALKLYDEHRASGGTYIVQPPFSVPQFSGSHPVSAPPIESPPRVEGAGFSITCRHCGEQARGATKFATVCFGCKSDGHSNQPSE